jgi:hypothetical protein
MARRIVITGLMVLSMLFIGNAVAFSQGTCGDIDGNDFLDIKDVVAMYEYLYIPGTPPPVGIANADTDPFPGIDFKDFTFLNAYFFEGGPFPCTGVDQGSNLVGGQVMLDHVDGLNGSDEIIRQAYAKFHVRATNNTQEIFRAISNGFKVYSPDGATVAIHDFVPTDFLMDTVFIYSTALDTYNPDGFGWYGYYPSMGPGIPAGASDIAFTITLETFGAEDIGKTVCLDSAFYGVGGAWTWQVNEQSYHTPSWDGPHCFTIADFGANPPVTMVVTPDTLVTSTVEIMDDPSSAAFSIGEVSETQFAFSASETSSWFDLDKTEGIAPDMLYFELDTAGLAYGLYFDSILITADNASNSPMYVYVQLNHTDPDPCNHEVVVGDSLIFPSVTVNACNGVQPVNLKLANRIAGACIPISAPPEITIKGVSFEGLVTEDWDLNIVVIHSDSNYVHVGLINTKGYYLDLGETTVFNILFDYNEADCNEDEQRAQYFSWDTTLSDDPVRSLQFAANCSSAKTDPQFDPNRNIMTIDDVDPGDFQGDGDVSVSDLTSFVDYMFAGGAGPFLAAAMDVNRDCTGPDISDLTFVVDYLFAYGEAPQCGCVVDAQTSKIVSSMVTVATTFENDRTFVHINSPIDLRGVHITFDGASQGDLVSAYSKDLELPHGITDGRFNVGCLDLNGSATITAGNNVLFSVAGTHSIASAVVSDMSHQSYLATVASKTDVLPHEYALMQNYPNPFNPETVLRFSLAEKADYKLTVYNVTGQEVAKFTGTGLPGINKVTFDGSKLASGVYLYRLNAGTYAASKKMMLLK